jgi:hypothetical protein
MPVPAADNSHTPGGTAAMTMIVAIALYLAYTYVFWLIFLAVMSLSNARNAGKLPTPVLILAAPAIVVGVLMDFLFNLVATIPFADLPREPMFTQRLGRYKTTMTDSWRGRLAIWLCGNLLDPFQVGGHCRQLP